MAERDPPTVILLMGVAGSGKTTIGQRLARRLGWSFRDADSFHPQANIDKMTSGLPLTDDDRWPWLDAIAAWMDRCTETKQPGVVTCSALKYVYRTRLIGDRHEVRLVYLKGSRQLIAERMARRKNHFMPTTLLDSQFAALEEPRPSERALVVSVAMPPNRIIERIVSLCRLPLAASSPDDVSKDLPNLTD